MKIAAVQFTPVFGEVEQNLLHAKEMIVRADADLVVLPELAFTGYVFRDRAELASFAEDRDGSSINFIADVARQTKTTICFGFPEQASGKIYNSAALVTPDGLAAVYRKIHLFKDELDILDPGEEPFFVTEVGGLRLGMMICYDWYFPESARSLALQGAQIILHPANLILPFCQNAMITRCLENKVFAITSNRGGLENRTGKSLKFTGLSQITRVDGTYERLPDDADGIVTADIDPTLADNKMMTSRNQLLRDRRPHLYFLGKTSS